MRIIGLTGGIGSGKSTVAKILHHMGIPVYYADNRAKELVYHEPIRVQLSALLGANTFTPEGEYNRTWVASQVFDNPQLLNQLNGILHPAVKEDFKHWVHQQNAPIVVKEAALIQSRDGYDEMWVVFAPLEVRIQRILRRDPQRSLEQVQSILQRQPTESFFQSLATHSIHNGPYDILTTQILAAL